MSRSGKVLFTLFLLMLFAASCGESRRVRNLNRQAPEVMISLPGERSLNDNPDTLLFPKRDTLEIYDFDGNKVMIMNAVKDDETGEMVAHEVLNAAVVTARFRNVAERHGKVDLEFQVTVPRMMLERDWQTRFYPDMFILEDSVRMDMLILTGDQYRKAQLRGYQRYNDFLASIVSDTTRFINLNLLEIFLQRNIPQVYAFKHDTTFVSEEQFTSCFGVTERQAIEHYTNKIARYLNERRKSKIGAMYRRYVKAPIITDHVRLDTIFVNPDGDFVYNYIQTIQTRPKLRKVDIVLSGEIFQQDLLLYNVPRCEPLTFYISSISAFTDNTERYMTKVIERRAEANTSCNLVFDVGKADIRPELGDNAAEIARIKDNLRDVLQNEKFDLDSITVRSWASPEGSVAANNALSDRRAASAVAYFSEYMRHIQDSIRRDAGFSVVLGDDGVERRVASVSDRHVRFKSASGGENWKALDEFVRNDADISEDERGRYFDLVQMRDLDSREARMRLESTYAHFKNGVYPRLRSVEFNFHMHRKGMVKDTVHTTELDMTYMRGVQAIRDRDYEAACVLLAPYRDYNAAVAYLGADRNMSALQILEQLDHDARVNYMLAIIYSRLGDEQKAVQHYMHSCAQEHMYVNRGNLDPEIAYLIKKYDLNKQDDDEFDYL